MADKQPLKSEGEQLDRILDELEQEHTVKEIAGWETGFPNLSRALDGILPGLYWLVGPASIGKTTLAKQLLDQIAMHDRAPAIFFAFVETMKELRIKTLARLSGLEGREIRRGSAFLLHWYGVPKAQHSESERLPPSWEKLKRAAEEAKSWLDLTYLVECGRESDLGQIEQRIGELKTLRNGEQVFAVIDDCQRLGNLEMPPHHRLALVAERLKESTTSLKIPILAVWPDLGDRIESAPQAWTERVRDADVIMVMERDVERTKKLSEPNEAITLHIVKNRSGERGKLALDFYPAFAKFAEASPG